MRTLASAVYAAEQDATRKPQYKIELQDELIRWAPIGDYTPTEAAPPYYVSKSDGRMWGVKLNTSGVLRHRSAGDDFDPATPSAWVMDGPTLAGTCMRASITDAGQVCCTVSGGCWIAGVYGATSNWPWVSQADVIRRVEAVLYTSLGTVVAYGHHRITSGGQPYSYTTIEFWLSPTNAPSSWYRLRTLIQVANTYTSFTGQWWEIDPWSALIDAVAFDGRIVVVASMRNKSVSFTIQNGVESELRDIIQVDEYGDQSTFQATGLARVGSLLYMSGTLVRRMADNSVVSMQTLLTSADGDHWSIGDQNFMIDSDGQPLMTLAKPAGGYLDGRKWYCAGQGTVLRADARTQDLATPAPTDITASVTEADHSATTGSADSVRLTLLPSAPALGPGSVIDIQAGYGQLGQIARVKLDQDAAPVTVAGRGMKTASCMDYGNARLVGWKAPVDVDRWSGAAHDDPLTHLGRLTPKTPATDIITDASGLHSSALNDPLIAYATCRTGGHGLTRIRYRFPSGQADTYCMPYVGVVFGATNDAQFNSIVWYPRSLASAWERYGLEWRRSALPAPSATDPSEGGFNVEAHLAPAIQAKLYSVGTDFGYCSLSDAGRQPITFGVAATTTNMIAPDYDYDVIVRVWGSKIYVFHRLAEYTNAANAECAIKATYDLADTAVRRPGGVGREYVGLIVGTDVFATVGAPPSLCGDVIEAQLSSAKDPDDALAWEYGSAYARRTAGGADLQASRIRDVSFGRGAFLKDDNTAFSRRRVVRTTGIGFDIFSDAGWDATNPKSGPEYWRAALDPAAVLAKVFNYQDSSWPATYGIRPGGSCFRIGTEILKCLSSKHTLHTSAGLMIHVVQAHTAFCLPETAADSATLTNWSSNGVDYPGDPFWRALASTIDSEDYLVGMSVDIRNKNGRQGIDNTEPLYVIAQSTSSASRTCTLNRNIATVQGAAKLSPFLAGDMMLVSGRGFYRTLRVPHTYDEPALYYPLYKPVDGAGAVVNEPPLTDIVNVKRFEHYSGLHNTIEDDLRFCCALSGARSVAFRSLAGPATVTLSPTWQSTGVTAGDFVIDMDATLTPPVTAASLIVGFRSLNSGVAYEVWVAQQSNGTFRVALTSPLSDVTPDGDGIRYLERVDIPAATSGVVSAGPVRVRVAVRGGIVRVELCRQLLWAFNLDAMTYTAGSPPETRTRRIDTPGLVQLRCYQSTTQVTYRILELSDEVENHVIDIGASGGDAVTFVTRDRYIVGRSTQAGGVEFGRFTARDDAGSYSQNLYEDAAETRVSEVRGHMQVSGAEFGEHIDRDWIRQNGYAFGLGSNNLLSTVQDSRTEAQLLIRLAKEMAVSRRLKGAAFPRVQPEDRIALAYAITNPAQNDFPSLAAAYWVVTGAQFTLRDGVFEGSYSIRSYQS